MIKKINDINRLGYLLAHKLRGVSSKMPDDIQYQLYSNAAAIEILISNLDTFLREHEVNNEARLWNCDIDQVGCYE